MNCFYKRFLLFILITISFGKYAFAQQDIIIPGIGTTLWVQQPRNANTIVNVKTPFIDFFKNIHLWKPHLALGVGLGITSYNILLDNLITVDSNKRVTFQNKNSDVKKYKLNTTYIELPIELRYRQNPDKHKHPFKLGVGAKLSYLVSSHTKTKYYPDASQSKSKDYDILYLNDFSYGPTVRVGLGSVALYASYDMKGLFDEAHASTIHQCVIGLCLNLSFGKDALVIPDLQQIQPKRTQTAFENKKTNSEIADQ